MANGRRRQQFWSIVLICLGIAGLATIAALLPDAVESTVLVLGAR